MRMIDVMNSSGMVVRLLIRLPSRGMGSVRPGEYDELE